MDGGLLEAQFLLQCSYPTFAFCAWLELLPILEYHLCALQLHASERTRGPILGWRLGLCQDAWVICWTCFNGFDYCVTLYYLNP